MSEPSAALDRLRAGLGIATTAGMMTDHPTTGPMRRAAVLALLWRDDSSQDVGEAAGLRIVAIEKTAHLRRHAGQIAFPGGRMEEGEEPIGAALREADEEVGVVASDVEVLGMLPPANVMASGFEVESVVGWWRRPVALRPVDLGEVAAVHQLPVGRLIDPANRATWVHPSGHSGPAFLVDDLFVWGLTAHLISGLLDLSGWSRPWDAERHLDIPQRFFRGRH